MSKGQRKNPTGSAHNNPTGGHSNNNILTPLEMQKKLLHELSQWQIGHVPIVHTHAPPGTMRFPDASVGNKGQAPTGVTRSSKTKKKTIEKNLYEDIEKCLLHFGHEGKPKHKLTHIGYALTQRLTATKKSIAAINEMLLEVVARIVSLSSEFVRGRDKVLITCADVRSAFSLICRYKSLRESAIRLSRKAVGEFNAEKETNESTHGKGHTTNVRGLTVNYKTIRDCTRSMQSVSRLRSDAAVAMAAIIETICDDLLDRALTASKTRKSTDDGIYRIEIQDVLVGMLGVRDLFNGHVPWAGNPLELHAWGQILEGKVRHAKKAAAAKKPPAVTKPRVARKQKQRVTNPPAAKQQRKPRVAKKAAAAKKFSAVTKPHVARTLNQNMNIFENLGS
jgi:hypothetical protein